jgi:hypothetical protein
MEKWMRVLVALAAGLILAACQTPCPAVNTEPALLDFACEDGSTLHVTMTPTQAVIEQEGYVTLTLPARGAGGGYRYSANGAELRGRSVNAQWRRPGAAETLCSVGQ